MKRHKLFGTGVFLPSEFGQFRVEPAYFSVIAGYDFGIKALRNSQFDLRNRGGGRSGNPWQSGVHRARGFTPALVEFYARAWSTRQMKSLTTSSAPSTSAASPRLETEVSASL